MKHICIALLRLYKATLSKWKGGKRCIYTPSCSVYSMEAYQQHGFFLLAVGSHSKGCAVVRLGARADLTLFQQTSKAKPSGLCSCAKV